MLGKPSVRFPLFFWLAYWGTGFFALVTNWPDWPFFTFCFLTLGVVWLVSAMASQYEINTEWSMTDEEREKWIMDLKTKYGEVRKDSKE